MTTKIPRILLEPLGESVSYSGRLAKSVEQYIRNPDENTFAALSSASEDNRQSLSDVFHTVLKKKPSETAYRHATISFWGERRLLEAAFFCDKLQGYNPNDEQICRMSAMIAGSRGDIKKLELEIVKLEIAVPQSSAIPMLRCLLHFIKNDYIVASHYAKQALEAPPPDRDRFAARLAVDVALKASDCTLLADALLLNGAKNLGQAQQNDAVFLLRRYVFLLLKLREQMKDQGNV